MSVRSRLLLLCCAPVLLTLAACGEPEDTRPGKPVATRQIAFKKMVKAFEPMGVMLRDDAYEPKGFALQAQKFSALKDGPWDHFGPDTQYPPSKSTDAIWAEPERFAQARERFLKAVAALDAAAASHNEQNVRKAYADVHGECKSCHKDFRNH